MTPLRYVHARRNPCPACGSIRYRPAGRWKSGRLAYRVCADCGRRFDVWADAAEVVGADGRGRIVVLPSRFEGVRLVPPAGR